MFIMSIIMWSSLGIRGALEASRDGTRLALNLKILEGVMVLNVSWASCSR